MTTATAHEDRQIHLACGRPPLSRNEREQRYIMYECMHAGDDCVERQKKRPHELAGAAASVKAAAKRKREIAASVLRPVTQSLIRQLRRAGDFVVRIRLDFLPAGDRATVSYCGGEFGLE